MKEWEIREMRAERDRLKTLGEATLKELREFFPTVQGDLITRWEAALRESQARCTECDGHGYVNGPPGPVGEPNGEPCPKCSTNAPRTRGGCVCDPASGVVCHQHAKGE